MAKEMGWFKKMMNGEEVKEMRVSEHAQYD